MNKKKKKIYEYTLYRIHVFMFMVLFTYHLTCHVLGHFGYVSQQKQAAEAETSDKIRTAAVSASQVAERNFPLADKMMMLLKEMEKSGLDEQGVAMASRFDVLCFKVSAASVLSS